MTIQDAYQKSVRKLKKDFITNLSLEARLLISYILNIDEKEFILIKDKKEINDLQFNELEKLINERVKGKSIASIIKKKYFYDLEFFVDDSVLIPRAETELIIDIILEKFDINSRINILDVGTGSGNIAIVLAKHLKYSKIDAIDINDKAIEITKKNAIKNGISLDRIKLLNVNFFKYSTTKKYDIIVSNPPYIKTGEIKELIKRKEISDPINALDGGKNGLNFYYRLNEFALNNLETNGWMFVEHGLGQREGILKILNNDKYKIEVYNDLAGIDRVIAVQYLKVFHFVMRPLNNGVDPVVVPDEGDKD